MAKKTYKKIDNYFVDKDQLKRYKNNSLIECVLDTGRTHQIRVSLEYIGFPVTNDPIYGKHKNTSEFGQMLHSKSIKFIHPVTNKEIYIECEIARKRP